MQQKTNNLLLLITPSYISASVTVGLALGFIGLEYLNGLGSNNPINESLNANYQYFVPQFYNFTESLTKFSFSNNFLLFLFWSLTGALIYGIANYLFALISKTVEIEKSLSYVNINRESLLETLLVSFAIRTASFFTWLVYCSVCLKLVLPYLISVVNELVRLPIQNQILPLIQLLAILCLALHCQVILVRLIALRARLFTS